MNKTELHEHELPNGATIAICFCAPDGDWQDDDWIARDGWTVQRREEGVCGVEVIAFNDDRLAAHDNRAAAFDYAVRTMRCEIESAEVRLDNSKQALEVLKGAAEAE